MPIQYVQGDVTYPELTQPEGNRLIAHCCNDKGGWGKGVVLSISKRWPEPESEYRSLASRDPSYFKLGTVQFITVERSLLGTTTVANIIGQEGYRPSYENDSVRYLRYDALANGFRHLREWALASVTEDEPLASVHLPRIGCGLAGGDWRVVEALTLSELVDHGIKVYVYDL